MKKQKIILMMSEVIEALSLSDHPQNICDSVLDTIIKLIVPDCCWIQLLHSDKRSLKLISSRFLSEEIQREVNLLHLGSEIGGQSLALVNDIIITDANKENCSNLLPFLKAGFRSIVIIPLRTYHLQGFLGLSFRKKNSIEADLVALLKVIGSLTCLSLDKSKIRRTIDAKENKLNRHSYINGGANQFVESEEDIDVSPQLDDSSLAMRELEKLATIAENYYKAVQKSSKKTPIQAIMVQSKYQNIRTEGQEENQPTKKTTEYKNDDELTGMSKNSLEFKNAPKSVNESNSESLDKIINSNKEMPGFIDSYKQHNKHMIYFRKSHS